MVVGQPRKISENADLRAAVHERLRALSVVGAFRVDPNNPGVTIVRL